MAKETRLRPRRGTRLEEDHFETITVYDKPADVPYEEAHALVPLSICTYQVNSHADYGGTTATLVCNSVSVVFIITTRFFTTSVATAPTILRMPHTMNGQVVIVPLEQPEPHIVCDYQMQHH